MKVFIINMEKDIERKNNVLKECAEKQITPEIIAAVNGREMKKEKMSELVDPVLSTGLSQSEIGCSLSHLKIYQKIVSENISKALILEDDVLLSTSFLEIMSYIDALDESRPTVYILSEIRKYIKLGAANINKNHSLVNATQASLSHCYIINLQGAKALLEFLTPVWLEADRWTFMRECGVIKLKAVVPPVGLLSTHSEQSTIWTSIDELEGKNEIREQRTNAIKLIRKQRSARSKIYNFLWKISVRKLYEVDANEK